MPPSGAVRSGPETVPSAFAPIITHKGESRITINLTLYKLPQILEGEALGEIVDALVAENQAAQLAAEDV